MCSQFDMSIWARRSSHIPGVLPLYVHREHAEIVCAYDMSVWGSRDSQYSGALFLFKIVVCSDECTLTCQSHEPLPRIVSLHFPLSCIPFTSSSLCPGSSSLFLLTFSLHFPLFLSPLCFPPLPLPTYLSHTLSSCSYRNMLARTRQCQNLSDRATSAVLRIRLYDTSACKRIRNMRHLHRYCNILLMDRSEGVSQHGQCTAHDDFVCLTPVMELVQCTAILRKILTSKCSLTSHGICAVHSIR